MRAADPFRARFEVFGKDSDHVVDQVNLVALNELKDALAAESPSGGQIILLKAPRAGYGKTLLLQRLASTLSESHHFSKVGLFGGRGIDASHLLECLLLSLCKAVDDPDGLTNLDHVARRVLAQGLEPLVASGEVPSQDREVALDALRNKPVETFDFHNDGAVTAHWTRANIEILGPRLAAELSALSGASLRDSSYWVELFFRYATSTPDNPERARLLFETVFGSESSKACPSGVAERLLGLSSVISIVKKLVFLIDDTEGLSTHPQHALELASFITGFAQACPQAAVILSLNEDVWETAFAPRLPGGLEDRLTENEISLSPLTKKEAEELLNARAGTEATGVLKEIRWPEGTLYARQVLKLASEAYGRLHSGGGKKMDAKAAQSAKQEAAALKVKEESAAKKAAADLAAKKAEEERIAQDKAAKEKASKKAAEEETAKKAAEESARKAAEEAEKKKLELAKLEREKKNAEAAARLAAEAEKQKAEKEAQAKKAEETRKAEEAKKAAEARKAEEAKKAAEAKKKEDDEKAAKLAAATGSVTKASEKLPVEDTDSLLARIQAVFGKSEEVAASSEETISEATKSESPKVESKPSEYRPAALAKEVQDSLPKPFEAKEPVVYASEKKPSEASPFVAMGNATEEKSQPSVSPFSAVTPPPMEPLVKNPFEKSSEVQKPKVAETPNNPFAPEPEEVPPPLPQGLSPQRAESKSAAQTPNVFSSSAASSPKETSSNPFSSPSKSPSAQESQDAKLSPFSPAAKPGDPLKEPPVSKASAFPEAGKPAQIPPKRVESNLTAATKSPFEPVDPPAFASTGKAASPFSPVEEKKIEGATPNPFRAASATPTEAAKKEEVKGEPKAEEDLSESNAAKVDQLLKQFKERYGRE